MKTLYLKYPLLFTPIVLVLIISLLPLNSPLLPVQATAPFTNGKINTPLVGSAVDFTDTYSELKLYSNLFPNAFNKDGLVDILTGLYNEGVWRGLNNSRIINPCGNPFWSCENIDAKPLFIQEGTNFWNRPGMRASTDLDSHGNLYIAYLEFTYVDGNYHYYLKYAFLDGSQWVVQTIEEVGNWHALPSIKVDSNDVAHISYFNNNQLKYASWNGSGWDVENVGSETGKYPSMDFDSNDTPHIVYCNGTDLKYATLKDNSWDIQIVNTNAACSADFGNEITLILDANGFPHILFNEIGSDYYDGIVYQYWNGNNWINQIIGPGAWITSHAMSLDEQGYPHVIYEERSACDFGTGLLPCGAFKHAMWDGNNWFYEIIGGSWTKDDYQVLGSTYDNLNRLHVSFSLTYRVDTTVFSDTRHAEWNGSSWAIEVVDNVPNNGFTKGPIVVDNDRKISICYFSQFSDDQLVVFASLRCAWKIETPKVSSIVRTSNSPTSSPSIDFTVTFSEDVQNVDVNDFSLTTSGVTGASITNAIPVSASVYTVSVNTGSGNGSIRLDVPSSASIKDLANNDLSGLPFTSGESYTISKSSPPPTSATFSDVPITHPYWLDIEILYANGLTAGCSATPLNFCPATIMNRAESAVFMLKGNFGNSYTPPLPPWGTFKDSWSPGTWAEKWAEGMYDEGLTAGCALGPLRFCPWDQTNREQAAVFGLKLKYGNAYLPPPATGMVFADMTDASYWSTRWTEQAYADGLLPSCGTGAGGKPNFCPASLVNRGLAAYMIVRAKDLSMP